MAEDKSVLDFPEITTVDDPDVVYVIHGIASDRDKKATKANLLKEVVAAASGNTSDITDLDGRVDSLAGAGHTTETVKDNADAIAALPVVTILEEAEDWTLPSDGAAGDTHSIIAKGSGSSILQVADSAITYQDEWATTLGVAGSLDIETKGRVDLVYVGESITKLDQPVAVPAPVPPVAVNVSNHGLGMSRDGTYFYAVSQPDYLRFFKLVNGSPVELTAPATIPSDYVQSAIFNDGTHLAIVQDVAPFLTLYTRTGDTWTYFGELPWTLPGNPYWPRGFVVGEYGTYAYQNPSTELNWWSISGTTWTEMPAVATGSAFGNQDICTDAAGVYVICNDGNTQAFKRVGSTLTLGGCTLNPHPGFGSGCAMSGDGNTLAIYDNANYKIYIYKRTGDVFNEIQQLTDQSNLGNRLSFNFDGTVLGASLFSGPPYILYYRRVGDVFSLMTAPSPAPAARQNGIWVSYDGAYALSSGVTAGEYWWHFKLLDEIPDQWAISMYESRLADLSTKFH